MSIQQGPSFGAVLGTVWKVICAIVLIPFLILLIYIAARVIPFEFAIAACAVAIAVGWVWLMRRISGR